MHGRFLTLPAALLMMAFAAGTAHADQVIGLGQPANADGVVTSWKLTSGGTQTNVTLRTVQGPLTTATSDPATASAGQAIAVRLPIVAGGQVQLAGASGSPGVAATVEPDADGDAFGDTTQDACPQDFTAHAAPCSGTTTFGSPLTLAPDATLAGGEVEARQSGAPGVPLAVTAGGVVTRLRLRAAPAAGETVVQVLRPAAGAGTFAVVAESAPVDAATDAVITVPAQITVQPGDVLAARSVGGALGAVAVRAGDQLATAVPRRPGDAAFPFTAATADRRLLVQADVEPDADGDGKGDITQEPPAPPPAPPAFVPPPQKPLAAPACANLIRGTRDDDALRGTVFGDRLVGGDGDDLLKGSDADDCLEGGAGSDVLDGGNGNDRLAGASGNDRLIGGNGDDKLSGSRGKDRLSGGNGNDTLSPGDGKDTILAGPGNDIINASDGTRETVDCGSGRDTVRADRRDRLSHCEKVTRRR